MDQKAVNRVFKKNPDPKAENHLNLSKTWL